MRVVSQAVQSHAQVRVDVDISNSCCSRTALAGTRRRGWKKWCASIDESLAFSRPLVQVPSACNNSSSLDCDEVDASLSVLS